MDSVRSAEKSRRKTRRHLQDHPTDLLNYPNRNEKSELGSVKTSPELETLPKHWAVVSEGFPPGVTVDELKKYGRRKQLTHLRPQDNLRLEEGSLKTYKSEYKRRFLPFCLPKVIQVSEENSEEKDADSLLKYSNYNLFLERPILRRPHNNLSILKDLPMESLTEKNSKFVPFPNCERRKLLRRSTALRPEGEIACETEVRKEYVDHKNPERARLIRKLPSLKLEGEFEPLTTEQRDKFITFLLSKRPVLEKKKTSLKMEGNFDFLTEKKLSYVPHEFSERPRIRKRSTSLKLEGEVEFNPEYRNSFVDFPRTRPLTYKPNGEIRHEGEFENHTETKTQYVIFENVSVPPSAKPENNLHVEGKLEINPEYRNNFVDFPRERPFLRRPFNQLTSEGNLELLTENSEKFSNVREPNKSEEIQKPINTNPEKELNFPPEKQEMVKKDETPLEVDSSKENVNSKQPEEISFLNTGFSVPEITLNRRPLSLRQGRDCFVGSDYNQFYENRGKQKNLKLMEDVKSNASSPRKKNPKEKIKPNFLDEKKSNQETFRRKSTEKRLKEASPKTELDAGIPNITKLEEEKQQETQQLKQNLLFSKAPSTHDFISPREYPAFKVLDVKGRVGCQSMMKDALDGEKQTSDEENPTYRLEVYNPGERSPGFHKNDRRIFPRFPLDSKLLEEAEMRAKHRAENYVKIVKSPEVPNSLLEETTDLTDPWNVPEKLCPLSPVPTGNERSFVVLNETGVPGQSPVGVSVEKKGEKKGWLTDSIDSMFP